MKKIDYSKRGPLIKVEIAPGRFVKMYERDAIARGLVKKERLQAVNKMLVPDEEKSPTPAAPDPTTPAAPSGSPINGGEINGDGDVVEVKRGKRKRTPHPGQIPAPKTPHPDPLPKGEGE